MPQGAGGVFLCPYGALIPVLGPRASAKRQARYLVVQGSVKFQSSKLAELNWNLGTRFWNFGIGVDYHASIVLAKRAKFQHFGTETPILELNSKTQNQIGTA
jgi:hypothetical protein